MDIHSLLLSVFYKPISNIEIDFPQRMHTYTHYIDDYTFYLFLYSEGIKGWDAFIGSINVFGDGGLTDKLHIDIPLSDNGIFCRRVCTRVKVRQSIVSRSIICHPTVNGFNYTICGGGSETMVLVAHAQYLSSNDFRLVVQRVDSFSGWKNAGTITYTFGGKKYRAEIADSDDIIQYTVRTCPTEYLNPCSSGNIRVVQPIILESLVHEPVILSHIFNTICCNPSATWEGILLDDFKYEFTGTEYLDTYMRLARNSMKIQLWSYLYLYKYGGAILYPNVILNSSIGSRVSTKSILDLVRVEEGIYTGYIYSKKQTSLFSELLKECKRVIGEYTKSSPENVTGGYILERCFKKIYGEDNVIHISSGIRFNDCGAINDNGIQDIMFGGNNKGRIFHPIMSGELYNILKEVNTVYMRKVDHIMKPFMNGTIKGLATNIAMYINGSNSDFSLISDIINDNTLSIRIKGTRGYSGWSESFNIFIEDKDSGRIQKKTIDACSESEKTIQYRVPWTLRGVSDYPQKIPKDIHITWKDYYLDKNIYDSYTSIVDYNPEYTIHMYSDQDARVFLMKYFNSDIISAFDALIPGSFKADLWRYCVLYEKGGVYVDHKVKFRGALRDVIGEGDEMVVPLDADKKHVQIGFMGFVPKHPLLKYVIDKTVENIKKEIIGLRDLEITGPIHFAKCCMQFYAVEGLCKNIILCSGHRWLWLNEDASHIYTNDGMIVADYHYKEYLSTRKDHYSYFWNNKTIYKIDSKWLR
jgi:hypothetical protein